MDAEGGCAAASMVAFTHEVMNWLEASSLGALVEEAASPPPHPAAAAAALRAGIDAGWAIAGVVAGVLAIAGLAAWGGRATGGTETFFSTGLAAGSGGADASFGWATAVTGAATAAAGVGAVVFFAACGLDSLHCSRSSSSSLPLW